MTIKMTEVWKTFGEGHTAVHALRDVEQAKDRLRRRAKDVFGETGEAGKES